jgi:hypothetical protein
MSKNYGFNPSEVGVGAPVTIVAPEPGSCLFAVVGAFMLLGARRLRSAT